MESRTVCRSSFSSIHRLKGSSSSPIRRTFGRYLRRDNRQTNGFEDMASPSNMLMDKSVDIWMSSSPLGLLALFVRPDTPSPTFSTLDRPPTNSTQSSRRGIPLSGLFSSYSFHGSLLIAQKIFHQRK